MTTQYVLGALGVVATIVVGLLVYTQARRSFARTGVHLSAEFFPESDAGIAFIDTLGNTGRYPAFIETVSIRLRTGALVPFRNVHGEALIAPLRLTEEAPIRLDFPISSLMREIRSPLAVRRIEATTTDGKSYSFPARTPWSAWAFSRHIRSRWTEEHQSHWADDAQGDT